MKKYFPVFFIILFGNIDKVFCQWQQLGGLGKGQIHSMVSGGSVLYASCFLKPGLFTSVDSGKSWQYNINYLPGDKIPVCLAASDNSLYASFFSDGIYYSIDNGKTWISRNSGLTDSTIQVMLFDKGDLIAGASNGLFRLKKDSINWERIDTQQSIKRIISLAVYDSNMYVGVSGGGLFCSHDIGKTWSIVDSVFSWSEIKSLAVLKPYVFASTNNGLYRSGDAGNTWTLISNGMPPGNVICLGSNGPVLYAAKAFDGIYVSLDSGASWTKGDGLPKSDVVKVFTFLDDKVFAGFNFGLGVFRSDNHGMDWYGACDGIDTSNMTTMFSHGGNVVWGTSRSIDDGITWKASYNGMNIPKKSGVVVKDIKMLTKGDVNEVFASNDKGVTWNLVFNDSFVFSINAVDSYIIIGSRSFCYVSEDSGKTFTPYPIGNKNTEVQQLLIRGNEVFAGTFFGEGVYYSADRGKTWVQRGGGLDNLAIMAIEFLDSVLFVATQGSIYKSYDNGLNWELSGLQIPKWQYVNSLFSVEKCILAGTTVGLFASWDGGNKWFNFGDGLPQPLQIYGFGLHKDYLYVGGNFKGVARRSLSQILSTTNYTIPGASVNIFPVPIADKLYIQFGNFDLSGVKVKIFSTQGNEVYSSAMIQELIEVDTNDINPGFYYIVIYSPIGQWVEQVVKL